MKRRRRIITIGVVLACCVAAVAVAVALTRVPWDQWHKTPPWVWWHVPGQGQMLDVSFASQSGCQLRADVAESESTVMITGWIRCRLDAPMHTMIGIPTTIRVRLSTALGDRQVIDFRGGIVPERIA